MLHLIGKDLQQRFAVCRTGSEIRHPLICCLQSVLPDQISKHLTAAGIIQVLGMHLIQNEIQAAHIIPGSIFPKHSQLNLLPIRGVKLRGICQQPSAV